MRKSKNAVKKPTTESAQKVVSMITSSRIDIAVIIFHVSNIDGNKLISKNLIERREFHNA